MSRDPDLIAGTLTDAPDPSWGSMPSIDGIHSNVAPHELDLGNG